MSSEFRHLLVRISFVPKARIDQIPVWFCLAGLLLGLFSILAAHPRLGFGILHDAEGVGVVVLCGAALCLLGVAGQVMRTRGFGGVSHPVVVVSLALGLWGAVCGAFAEFPLTALFGPPQSMYGALWFIAQAAFIAAAVVVGRGSAKVLAISAASVAAIALMAIWFNARHVGWLDLSALSDVLPRQSLLSFNEYLGYHALALLALSAVALRRGWKWGAPVLALIALLLLAISGNRTAWAAAVMAAIVLLLLPRLPGAVAWRRRFYARPHLWAGAFTAVVLLVSLAPYVIIRFGDADVLPPSLLSRRILFQVAEPSLFAHPLNLLLGNGWGHFPFHLQANLPSTGISFIKPEWIDFARDEFHSHNALLEALFASGLPGAVLMVLFPTAIVIGARPALRPVAAVLALALALVDAMWFMMPENMVPIALAIVATAKREHALPSVRLRSCIAAGAVVLALGLAVASAWQARTALAMEDLQRCLRRGTGDCQISIPTDPRQSDVALASLISVNLLDLQRRKWPPDRTERFGLLLADASGRCPEFCSPRLSLVLVDSYFSMAYTPAAAAAFSAERWRDAVLGVMRQAPLRVDAAAPYLNWLLINGKSRIAAEVMSAFPPQSHASPVWGWFSGLMLLEAEDADERGRGLALMRQALANDVERYMTVDPSIKSALEEAR